MEEQGHCLIEGFGNHYGEDCPHHLRSRGSGGDDIRGNIIRVCFRHHTMIHSANIPRDYLYKILENL
jgi:hypothetical protein